MFGSEYFQAFEATGAAGLKLRGTNVVGFIEAKKFKDKYIVVSAHYDHVGVRKGEIYNGADDNASGTSALFALAEYFNKNRPSHTIIFAACTTVYFLAVLAIHILSPRLAPVTVESKT